MTKDKIKELRTKILKGIELSFTRLLIAKQKEDGELVISRNGKILRVKAKDLAR
jgi:hypothetical protein